MMKSLGIACLNALSGILFFKHLSEFYYSTIDNPSLNALSGILFFKPSIGMSEEFKK